MDTKELVLTYFNSWQTPTDFKEMSNCFASNAIVDAEVIRTTSREKFVGICIENPALWRDVKLISSLFKDEEGVIIYEGINTANDQKMRIAEHIVVENLEIVKIFSVISQLSASYTQS